MSTRSLIAKMNSDGTVEAMYCHWDGYLSNNGLILLNNYKDNEVVNVLFKNDYGSMSSLGITPGKCEWHYDSTYEDEIRRFPSSEDFFKENDVSIEYRYLWNGVEWVSQSYTDTPIPLKDAIEKDMKENPDEY